MPVKPNSKGLQNYVPAGNPDGGEYTGGTAEAGSIPKEKYKETTIAYQEKVGKAKDKIKNAAGNKPKPNDKQEDTKREYKANPTIQDYEANVQYLKKHEVIVGGNMEKLGVEYAYHSTRLLADVLDELPAFKEACKNGGLEITAGALGYRTIADCSGTNAGIFSNNNTLKSKITMNTNGHIVEKQYKSKETSGELGFKMPCAMENALGYSMVHEVGHAIINHIAFELKDATEEIRKEREELKKSIVGMNNVSAAKRKLRDYGERLPREICKQINNIAKELGEPRPSQFISGYGKTNVNEYFAECFANSMCGKPNILGKATKIWLERNYKNGVNKTLLSKK